MVSMSRVLPEQDDECRGELAIQTNGSQQPLAGRIDVERLELAVREILLAIGEDVDRASLIDTPSRVARMYAELFTGLRSDPRRHLQRAFEEQYDELVLVRDISFNSMCETPPASIHGSRTCRLPAERKNCRSQ